jgi:hypothetical protein
MRSPEFFQHVGRKPPVLQLDQGRGGIVFRCRADVRGWRDFLDTQEMSRGKPVILKQIRLLALLIDSCCLPRTAATPG